MGVSPNGAGGWKPPRFQAATLPVQKF